VLQQLAARDRFSATELESYVRCPYQWFYQRTIRPEALDGEVGTLEAGSVVHRVLQRFYAEALPDRLGVARVDHEHIERALDLVDEVLDAALAEPGAPAAVSLFEEDQIARARDRVRGLVSADADFLPSAVPRWFEWAFGAADAPVPIGDFTIHGRVDRIDESNDGLVVMDYKLGNPPGAAELKDGRSLQVMLYAHAVETVMGRPVPLGFYRGLKDGKDLRVVTRDRLTVPGADGEPVERTYLDLALEAAAGAVAGIRAGRIAPEPKSGACRYCAARGTCPRRQS